MKNELEKLSHKMVRHLWNPLGIASHHFLNPILHLAVVHWKTNSIQRKMGLDSRMGSHQRFQI